MGVLQGIGDGEVRVGAEQCRGVAGGEMQVDEQRLSPGAAAASFVARFTATVVAPTPPFPPTIAKIWPAGEVSCCCARRCQAMRQVGDRQRLDEALGHAGAHGLEHHRGLEGGGDQRNRGAWMQVLDLREGGRRALRVAQIDEQDGCGAASGLSQRRQLRRGQRRRLEAACSYASPVELAVARTDHDGDLSNRMTVIGLVRTV